jgi:hypothetical protein
MPRDPPVEQDVGDLRAGADVVLDHPAAAGAALGHHHADVRQLAVFPQQVPRDDVAGRVVFRVLRDGERLPVAAEEDLEVRDAAVIDVAVGAARAPLARIVRPGALHVLVHQLLQVHAGGTVDAHDLVGADPGVGRDVAAGIRDGDVLGLVARGMVGAVVGGGDQRGEELFARGPRSVPRLLRRRCREQQRERGHHNG